MRFDYFDEEFMTDAAAIEKGVVYMNEAMINTMDANAVEEFLKSKNVFYGATWTYDNVVDAQAMLNRESTEGFFMLISPAQRAAFKKNLKDTLQFVEAFVRTGYIGNLDSLPVYVSKQVPDGKAIIASKEAVTSFLKAGVAYESERDANTRKNSMWIRKYGVVALTDDRMCVVLDSAAAPAGFTALTKNDGAEVVVDGHGVKVTGDAVIAGVPADYASLFALPTNKDIVVELDGIIPAGETTTIVQTNPALKAYYEAGDATVKKVGNSYVKTETYDGSDTDLAVLVREGKKVALTIGDNKFTVDGTFTLAE